MANFFDQFDQAAAPPAQPGSNFFDQFDTSQQPETKKPFSIGNALAETWPARLVKGLVGGAVSGATLPHDVMTGQAKLPSSGAVPGSVPFGDSQSSGERVADLAFFANPINPAVRAGDMAIPGARAVEGAPLFETIGKGTDLGTRRIPNVTYEPNLVKAKAQVPTAEELHGLDSGFDASKGMGVELAPRGMQEIGQQIERELQNKGIYEEHAPIAYAQLKRLAQEPGDAKATISDIHNIRQAFGNAAGNFSHPKDTLAGSMGVAAIDRYLASIPKEDILAGPAASAGRTLQDAIGNHAAAMRSDAVTGRADLAALRAKVSNSGQNLDNATRQRFVDIASNGKAARGFSDEEIAQALRLAEGSKPTNAARFVGNALGGGGGLGMAVTGGLGAAGGAAIGGLVGSPIAGAGIGATVGPVIGASAKKLANVLTSRQVGKLDEMVRSRSPEFERRKANPGIVQGPRSGIEQLSRMLMESANGSRNSDAHTSALGRLLMKPH